MSPRAVLSGPLGILTTVIVQHPTDDLPLPYLIDALAQLKEATTARARYHNRVQDQLAERAVAEGKPGDYYEDMSRWQEEREGWHKGIAPLERLVAEQFKRAVSALGVEEPFDPFEHKRLLNALVAAARLRAGGTPDVDVLHER